MFIIHYNMFQQAWPSSGNKKKYKILKGLIAPLNALEINEITLYIRGNN